jgi:3'(2'), 5'-bisphosphate nucleotidase
MVYLQLENWANELLPQAVDLARQAGKAIMAVYGDVNPAYPDKPDSSPLTKADLVSHDLIVSGLARLSPDWPVLSEESEEIIFDQRSSWQYFWLVDPLDGTKEFQRHNSEFTVNIALIARSTPILGIVYAPAIEKMYFAAKGGGAFRADGETTSEIQAKGRGDGVTRVVVSRSHLSNEENLDKFIGATEKCEFIRMGSSLKFCLVAEGTADIYLRTGPTMEWDTAAAECILVEAGGAITNLHGDPMEYNKPILRNPAFVARTGSRSDKAILQQLTAKSATETRKLRT